MGARRASIVLAACVSSSFVIGGPGIVTAQADATDQQLCISVTGTAPADGWDVLSLSVAIASGNATITTVEAASACGGAGTPVEEPPVEEPAIEEPDAAAAEPLPVEVEEAGIIGKGDQAAYYAILRNPNPDSWLARFMPVTIDLLDDDGELVSTFSNYATILPGQVGVVAGYPGDATGATRLEAMVANGEEDWSAYVDVPGDLSFSEVKTRMKDSTIKTVGRISSSFDEQLDRVSFDVVYRDPTGHVVGTREGSVDFVPANGDASFMVQSYSEKKLDIATTEVYVSDFLPPTE